MTLFCPASVRPSHATFPLPAANSRMKVTIVARMCARACGGMAVPPQAQTSSASAQAAAIDARRRTRATV